MSKFLVFRCGFFAALFLVLGSSAPLSAVEVRPPPFAELVQASDYVVRARVVASRSDWEGDDAHRQIFSYLTVDVLEVLSGAPPEPLVLRVLGGKIGTERVRIEGMPELRVGSEYVLFVRGNERQFFPLVAMMHGMYPVVRKDDTSPARVTRSNGAPLRSTADVSQPMTHVSKSQLAMESALPALTLDQFQDEIRLNAKENQTDALER